MQYNAVQCSAVYCIILCYSVLLRIATDCITLHDLVLCSAASDCIACSCCITLHCIILCRIALYKPLHMSLLAETAHQQNRRGNRSLPVGESLKNKTFSIIANFTKVVYSRKRLFYVGQMSGNLTMCFRLLERVTQHLDCSSCQLKTHRKLEG